MTSLHAAVVDVFWFCLKAVVAVLALFGAWVAWNVVDRRRGPGD